MVQLVVGGFGVWGPLVFGAAGAAYVLAKLQGRKNREEVLAFTILMGVVLVSSYLFLLLAGHIVARLVFKLASA
jgi:nucleoside permease NupC